MLLHVNDISKSFGTERVLQHISFELVEAQTMAILGKSGSGKTSLLRIIAGLTAADEGQILLAGKDISSKVARLRNIVYISQEPLLFPHLTVFHNIAFGLQIRKQKEQEIKQKVELLVEELGLAEHLHKKPHQLSGGQKQRVNFGRALIIEPPLLLLDEPFASLDTQTRAGMQVLFKQVSVKHGITSLFVTHDLKEALLLGDCISLMEKGTLKTYPDKISFIKDTRSGVQNEISFWKNISA